MLVLGEVLEFFKIKIPIVTALLTNFGKAIAFLEGPLLAAKATKGFKFFANGGWLAGATPMTRMLLFIPNVLNKITFYASRFLAPLFLLVFAFQLISRSIAHFKIAFAERVAVFIDRLTQVGAIFARIIAVFDDGFDRLARILALSPIMDLAFKTLEVIASIIEWILFRFAAAMGGFQGLTLAVMEFFYQIYNVVTTVLPELIKFIQGAFNPLTLATGGPSTEGLANAWKSVDFGKVGEIFNYGQEDMYERIYGKIESGELIAQTNNEIHKMEVNFDIKEKVEPDRIAFTLQEVLTKASQNRSSARGRGYAPTGNFAQ